MVVKGCVRSSIKSSFSYDRCEWGKWSLLKDATIVIVVVVIIAIICIWYRSRKKLKIQWVQLRLGSLNITVPHIPGGSWRLVSRRKYSLISTSPFDWCICVCPLALWIFLVVQFFFIILTNWVNGCGNGTYMQNKFCKPFRQHKLAYSMF